MPCQLVGGDGRERPAQVAVAGVVEHVVALAAAHAGHHVGHHGAQAGPGFAAAGVHTGEELVHPGNQRADAVGADVVVNAVVLGSTRHAEAVCPKAAGDQLSFVVQQADPGCCLLAGFVVQRHGNRVALDRVNVQPVAQLRGNAAAVHTGAHHHAVKAVGLSSALVMQLEGGHRAVGAGAGDLMAVKRGYAQARTGLRQAVGELVDVAGGVALGVVAAVIGALQGGLNGAHFLRRDGAAREATGCQHGGDLARMLKTRLVAVDVQDAFALVVEVNALCLRPGKQVFAGRNGQAGGGFGVLAVLGDGGYKLCHPAQLVPGGGRVHEQGRVLGEHPFQPLHEGAGVGPDLGVGGRELAAVGIGRFHARVAVLLDQGDLVAGLGQGVGAGNAGDAAADDGYVFHESSFRCVANKGTRLCTLRARRAPSV